MFKSRFAGKALLVVPVLVIGLLVTPITSGKAGATLSTCGGCAMVDPTVYLSNGVVLVARVQVNDSLSDVTGVTYQVHVPWGLTATNITYDGPPQVAQSLQVVADQPRNTFTTVTVVSTTTSQVRVYPFMSLTLAHLGSVSMTGSGTSNQAATLTWSPGQDGGNAQYTGYQP